jgi:predicted permease
MGWLRRLFSRERLEADLDKELRFHFESQVADKVRSGISESEARRLTRIEFGGIEQIKEDCRERRGTMWLESLSQDVRYAIRQLRNSPSFTSVALLTLALGIGANTAIFSIIQGTLELPYANADRMVVVKNVSPRQSHFAASWPDFLEWRGRSKSFTQIAGIFTSMMTWKGDKEPQSLFIGLVTEGYFGLYEMQPIVGRVFLPSEHVTGSTPVCALGEDFWREQFNGDASVVGKPLYLDGKACTVIGVMSRVVPDSNHSAQVWIPMEPNLPFREHGSDFIRTTGLLRPGVSQTQALSDLRNIQTQVDKQFPETAHDLGLQSLSQNVFGDVRAMMFILWAAVGFILLIACVNLAIMLLARASGRAREFAVRRALGASAARLIQQTLAESLLLSVSGAFAGLAVAAVFMHIPIGAWPKGFLPPSGAHLNGEALAFTSLLALITGVLFGIVPMFRILRQNDKSALRQGHITTDSLEQNHTGSMLVIAEIAFSMLLVAGALNMAFYLIRLMRTNPGVNPKNVLVINVWLSPQQYPDVGKKWRFYSTLLERLAIIPGVVHAAGSMDPPFWGSFPHGKFSYDDQPDETANQNPVAGFHYVTPGYFETVQTPIVKGRDFTPQDRPGSPKVVLINREMADRLWHGQSAIGKHIHCCYKGGDFEIVGIAGDVLLDGLAQPAGNEIYLSVQQNAWSQGLSFLLRTSGDPFTYVLSARHAVSTVDAGQAISSITSIETLADQAVAGQRIFTLVTAILGTLALLLASIGVYGVMAYSVNRREREFGIRLALGSSRSGILKILFSGLFGLVAAGMILGALLTFAMRAWIASILGTTSGGLLAFAASALLLCGVAALAALIPARIAMRIDPMQALRSE